MAKRTKSGFVYIVFNICHKHPESGKQLYKIGLARNLEARLKGLNQESGSPGRFEVFYACEVADMAAVEARMHEVFDADRLHKEFFACDPEKAKHALMNIAAGNEVEEVEGTASRSRNYLAIADGFEEVLNLPPCGYKSSMERVACRVVANAIARELDAN